MTPYTHELWSNIFVVCDLMFVHLALDISFVCYKLPFDITIIAIDSLEVQWWCCLGHFGMRSNKRIDQVYQLAKASRPLKFLEYLIFHQVRM